MNHYLVCENPNCRFCPGHAGEWKAIGVPAFHAERGSSVRWQMVIQWPLAAPRLGGAADEQTAALLVLQRKAKRKGGLVSGRGDNSVPDAFPLRATSWPGRRISAHLS